MSLFRLPATLCQRLQRMMVNFWWGASGEERKIHWRKWQLLCTPKNQGGLGFWDLMKFNQALLAKQAWRILTNPDSLAGKIYKAKYFPSGKCLTATLGSNSSYVWRSILWGRELLLKGLRWRITTGRNVSVFNDSWLMRRSLFLPITIPNHAQSDLMVADFINNAGNWNWDMIINHLWAVDWDEIKRIPVGNGSGNDKIIWHYSPNGVYKVKSGYFLAVQGNVSTSNGCSSGLNSGLRKLWKLRVPSKIKIHLWRSLFNDLSVRSNLWRRGIHVDPLCPHCNSQPKDIPHTFWYCRHVRKVWKKSSIWPIIQCFSRGSFIDLFSFIVEHDRGEGHHFFTLICWSLWIARNMKIFQGKAEDADSIIARGEKMKATYTMISSSQMKIQPALANHQHWQPPLPGCIKINVDAAVIDSLDHVGIGTVGRDNTRHVMCAEARWTPGIFSPHLAELLAIKFGVEITTNSGWTDWVVESNAINVIHAIQRPAPMAPFEPIAESV